MNSKDRSYRSKVVDIEPVNRPLFSLWSLFGKRDYFTQFEHIFKILLPQINFKQIQDINKVLQEQNYLLRSQNLLLKRQNKILQDRIREFQNTKSALRRKNEQLRHQANIDGLTQVCNRRCFDEYFAQEWQRCKQEQQPLSIIMVDIDYFKRYNDAYGHQAGDKCLFRVAQGMARVIKRSEDMVARYGGEEFAIILPNTDPDGAAYLAESIRQEITQLKIPHAQSKAQNYLTLSIGVASKIPTSVLSPAELLKTADQCLYQAKYQGRNRIIVSES